jgi:hypothetical protein
MESVLVKAILRMTVHPLTNISLSFNLRVGRDLVIADDRTVGQVQGL